VSGVGSKKSMFDNTRAMINAHATGQIVFYGAKRYRFTRLNIPIGGIIGRGESTILHSIDTSSGDIITYQGTKNDGYQTEECAGQFKDFSLMVKSVSQKTKGAGIKLSSDLANAEYSIQIYNVTIKNIPTSIHIGHACFYSIRDCYLASYSSYAIFRDTNKSSVDMFARVSNILNNVLMTDQAQAIGIKYRGENTQISANKINGGLVGVDISLVISNPVVHITDNAFEKQMKSCIRISTEAYIVERDNELFSQVLISQNRLNATSTESAAIYIAPEHFTLTDVSINNNLISYHGNEKSMAAINIQNSNRFMINNNSINCNNGAGYRGIYINQDCGNGVLSANHVILPLNGHTQNLSPTTTLV